MTKTKRIFALLITILMCITLFGGCSSAPENEILGTWEWTHDIDMGEDIGTVHNFSRYVFEKKDGKYMATWTFSGLSSPLTVEYIYKIEDSKLILTYLTNESKDITHDLTINENSLTIGDKEYTRISE